MELPLTQKDMECLVEIQRLLDEGLKHYLTYESHCKSSEGNVSIEISFGNSWQRFEGPVKPTYNVSVYSYALGPHRSHEFEYPEDALEAVKEWHAAEMAFDPEDEDEVELKALQNIFEAKPVQGGRREEL